MYNEPLAAAGIRATASLRIDAPDRVSIFLYAVLVCVLLHV